MHAVVGIWTMDEARCDEQHLLLREEIVPLAKSQPGFVSGYWMHDPETGKGHTAIIFDSRDSASGFKTFVESRTQRAAQAGVTNDILTTVEVVADAHQHGRFRCNAPR
jgi:heme-degrading monooxygenase HmoA